MAENPYDPNRPGMGADGRCMTCDGRYCGSSCDGREGYVYVVGMGWRDPEAATALERAGLRVYWDDVFSAERFG